MACSDEDAIEKTYVLHSDYWGSGLVSEASGIFIKLYWAAESTFLLKALELRSCNATVAVVIPKVHNTCGGNEVK